jgi:DNA-binding GntR family transcriptional regulator
MGSVTTMLTVSAKLSGENNKDYSYRVIKEGIMSLELQPGQAISEIELAEALHLSRTPIREVMTKLKEENLVEVFPQVGTYISKIKPQLVEEASFMRYNLEKEILKLACHSFPSENLQELKKNLALQQELISQKGLEQEFHRLDTRFHHIIYQGNKKENVWAAITRLGTHYNRIRVLSEIQYSFDEAIAQHEIIVTIIENKQVEKVEGIVRKHISDPIKTWDSLFQEDSPYLNYFEQIPAFL